MNVLVRATNKDNYFRVYHYSRLFTLCPILTGTFLSLSFFTYHGSKEQVFSGHGSEVARVGMNKTTDIEQAQHHRAWRYTSLPVIGGGRGERGGQGREKGEGGWREQELWRERERRKKER